jgi:hypothetical protein
VKEIERRFESLNPYSREAVPGSILKIEADNFDPVTRQQRQIWCLAISAKRYALFLKDELGKPVLLRGGKSGNNNDDRWSEHGLGHLLNPTDLESEDRAWIARFWENIICDCLGIKARRLPFEKTPAIGRVTITSPAVLKPFAQFNRRKKYRQRVKPFNFLLTSHISPLGHPIGVDPEKFHLIAPFDTNSANWMRMDWIDQYSGNKYKITTDRHYSSRTTARVQTFGDIYLDYAYHPEAKCADEHGKVCDRQTAGLLYRRHVRIGEIVGIGKESNRLEDVDAGLVHFVESVYATYPDPARDEWEKTVRPELQTIPLASLIAETGLSRRMLIKARKGQARPHLRNQQLIAKATAKLVNELDSLQLRTR